MPWSQCRMSWSAVLILGFVLMLKAPMNAQKSEPKIVEVGFSWITMHALRKSSPRGSEGVTTDLFNALYAKVGLGDHGLLRMRLQRVDFRHEVFAGFVYEGFDRNGLLFAGGYERQFPVAKRTSLFVGLEGRFAHTVSEGRLLTDIAGENAFLNYSRTETGISAPFGVLVKITEAIIFNLESNVTLTQVFLHDRENSAKWDQTELFFNPIAMCGFGIRLNALRKK